MAFCLDPLRLSFIQKALRKESLLNKKKPGDDLLSHREGSTIGVEELNFRVRYGNGCGLFTIVTRQINYLLKKQGIYASATLRGKVAYTGSSSVA